MAKFDYAKSKNTAHRLIDRFGEAGTLLRWISAGNYSEVDATMAVLQYDDRRIDGTRIRASDRMIIVSAVGVADISAKDRIRFNGVVYEIVPPVNRLAPAGTTIVLFEVQGRA